MNPGTETEEQGKEWMYLDGPRRMVAETRRNQERTVAAKLELRRGRRRERVDLGSKRRDLGQKKVECGGHQKVE